MRVIWLVLAAGCGSAPVAAVDAPPADADDRVDPPDECGGWENDSPTGVVEEVLAGIVDPTGLTLDATHLYFAHGRGDISRVARTGGPIEPIASEQASPRSLDATTDRLCWANGGAHAADFLNGSIRCAAKPGGSEVELSSAYMPGDMAIEGGTVYWAEIDGQSIRSVDLDGSNPQTLDTSYTSKTNIAVTPTTIVWGASGKGAHIVAMDRNTGTPTALASNEYGVTGLALQGEDVFWTIQRSIITRNGAVRVTRAGDTPSEIVANECAPSGLVQAGGSLYWTSWDRIRTTSTSSGGPITLANRTLSIGDLVVDGDYLYWSEFDGGQILRMRRF